MQPVLFLPGQPPASLDALLKIGGLPDERQAQVAVGHRRRAWMETSMSRGGRKGRLSWTSGSVAYAQCLFEQVSATSSTACPSPLGGLEYPC